MSSCGDIGSNGGSSGGSTEQQAQGTCGWPRGSVLSGWGPWGPNKQTEIAHLLFQRED